MPQITSTWKAITRGAIVLIILALLPFQPVGVKTVQAASGCAAGKVCTFLPILTKQINPTGDLQITSVEVTQAIQTAANDVPLVAGRSTMLRIYAQGQEALPAGSANVNVAISANPVGPAMSSTPLEVVSPLQAAPSRSVYASTINVALPAAWTTGSYDLTVTIDPQNQVPEGNEANNSYVLHLAFTTVPALRLKIVPVRYTHTDGHTYPAPSQDSISGWIMRTFPLSQVEISWHAAYNFTGNMKDVASFSTLLSQINTLKKNENAPADQVYYALVPTSDGSLSWFSGGVVGIGYVGSRTAVGLDYYNGGLTAAHEIGHNLGRQHAPCGGVSSSDPAFPYAGASIGEYGLDLVTNQVYTPEIGRDLMSYCSPKWVSDYTYRALLQAQIDSTAAAAPAASMEPAQVLMIRAQVGPDGAQLAPVYAGESLPDAPAPGSPYYVQLIGMDGQVLAEQPVQVLEIAAEAGGLPSYEIQANLARPDGTVREVRLLKAGQVITSGQLLDGTQTAALHMNAATLTGTAPFSGPAQVRYSLDGGATWTILAMDVDAGSFDLAGTGLPENALVEILPALTK